MLRLMRVSEALADEKPLDVHFPSGAVLHIRYKPSSYTIADIASLDEEARQDPTRVLRAVRDMVTWWDLEDNSGEPIPLLAPPDPERIVTSDGDSVKSKKMTPEEERKARLAADPMAQKVAISILTRIIRAVNEDQSAGE